jgi:hypothetical protein
LATKSAHAAISTMRLRCLSLPITDGASRASRLTPRVIVRVFYARVLWLQGHADEAARTAEMSVAEAQSFGHVMTLCYALALAACSISLWVGDLAAATR